MVIRWCIRKREYWGNVNSIGPRSVYDEAKRYAEAITMAYHRTHGLDTPIVRIFNTTARPWRLRMNTEPLRRFSMTKKSLPIIWLMGRTWRQRRPA